MRIRLLRKAARDPRGCFLFSLALRLRIFNPLPLHVVGRISAAAVQSLNLVGGVAGASTSCVPGEGQGWSFLNAQIATHSSAIARHQYLPRLERYRARHAEMRGVEVVFLDSEEIRLA